MSSTSCHPDPQRGRSEKQDVGKDLTCCMGAGAMAGWHVPADDDTAERKEDSPCDAGHGTVRMADGEIDTRYEGFVTHTDGRYVGVGCRIEWLGC